MKWLSLFKRNKVEKRYAIIDISDANFEKQVIRRSYKTPVLVDFWAAWCVPCRQLGPVLEKIAEDQTSRFILAKLNTETNKRSAAKFNIRSIPAVKMFQNGQIVGEFTGALPEVLVRQFIQKSTAQAAPMAPGLIKGDKTQRFSQAKKHLRKGRGFEAFILLQTIPEDEENEETRQLKNLARFIYDIDDGDALTGVEDLDALYQKTVSALRHKNPRKALATLDTALQVGESIDREVTQSVIDGINTLLGKSHKEI